MHGQPLSVSSEFEILVITLLVLLASSFCSSWLLYFLKWHVMAATTSVVFHLTTLMSTYILLRIASGPYAGPYVIIIMIALITNLPNAHVTYQSIRRMRTKS